MNGRSGRHEGTISSERRVWLPLIGPECGWKRADWPRGTLEAAISAGLLHSGRTSPAVFPGSATTMQPIFNIGSAVAVGVRR